MKTFSFYFLLLACVFSLSLKGQELILPLAGNPAVGKLDGTSFMKKALQADTLDLPFLDDFSYGGYVPKESHWSDRNAFINISYAVMPPSIGVATLDAVDSAGSIYAESTLDPRTFTADLLTSRPIRMEYPESDSIYLSFYYQPMGNGIEPSSYDSLCLDFYSPVTENWSTIWSTSGDTVRPFRQVMIPVKETRYLTNGFRFRFRNLASLPKNTDYLDKRGNVDHWNIDYVKIDRNRFRADTVIRDVAFQEPVPSMLKNYQSIPWDHFDEAYNELYLPYIDLFYFNNDTATRNITRKVIVSDPLHGESYQAGSPTAQDVFPGQSATARATSIYPFEFDRGDTAIFEIEGSLRTDEFDYKENDTLIRKQVFRDYFAYDDGTAERAYGLRGQGTNNSYIAVRFRSYIEDALGGVDICFTQLKDSLNLDYFYKFVVWDDNNGEPGEIIYEDDADYSVTYSDEINQFIRIRFQRPVPVNGTFYVGLQQYNQFMLNIGLDVNNPAAGNLLYNLGEEWLESKAPGIIMMRPWVNRYYSAIESREYGVPEDVFSIYPNPVDAYLHIGTAEASARDIQRVDLIDLSGRTIRRFHSYDGPVYVGDIEAGLYVVIIDAGHWGRTARKVMIGP